MVFPAAGRVLLARVGAGALTSGHWVQFGSCRFKNGRLDGRRTSNPGCSPDRDHLPGELGA